MSIMRNIMYSNITTREECTSIVSLVVLEGGRYAGSTHTGGISSTAYGW